MQFEEFNKKIKEAAEQHHPAYDEKAWQKMEKMLDKHMPQEEKDRRRIIFFLLIFLLLGGGIFLAIDKPWQRNTTAGNDSTVTVPKDNSQVANDQPTNNSVLKDRQGGQQSNTGTVNPKEEAQFQQTAIDNVGQQKRSFAFETNSGQKKINDESLIEKEVHLIVDNGKNELNNEIRTNNETKKDVNNLTNTEVLNKKDQVSTGVNRDNVQSNLVVPKKDDPKQLTAEEDKTGKNNNSNTTEHKNKTGNKKFLDGLAFSISGGPDVSKAGSSQVGKTTIAFGGGISYSFKKFTLRSGLYSARKIYTAGENDYKLSYTLPQNIKFEGADANCRVLEIPFSLTYNFISKNGNSWFAGGGLSSYLMSREDYTYWYTNSTNGSYYSRYYEIKNKYKHYFSVINLSAGYTRQLNRSVSITAEPYVKIPFQGIGLGNVHLNSGGVLFTLGIQPFNNKKKN
jgi:hypothetical protein